MAQKKTKKAYEQYMNEIPMQGQLNYIIGGKYRPYYHRTEKYGSALRKFDPIAFEVGFNEWKNNGR